MVNVKSIICRTPIQDEPIFIMWIALQHVYVFVCPCLVSVPNLVTTSSCEPKLTKRVTDDTDLRSQGQMSRSQCEAMLRQETFECFSDKETISSRKNDGA